jgi:hypothetical protein
VRSDDPIARGLFQIPQKDLPPAKQGLCVSEFDTSAARFGAGSDSFWLRRIQQVIVIDPHMERVYLK